MFTSAGVPLFPLHLLPKPDLESLPAGVGALHVKQMRSSPTGPTSTEWRNYHHVINANIMRLIEMEVFKRRGAGGGVSGGAGGAIPAHGLRQRRGSRVPRFGDRAKGEGSLTTLDRSGRTD